jgi:hypothetical protein
MPECFKGKRDRSAALRSIGVTLLMGALISLPSVSSGGAFQSIPPSATGSSPLDFQVTFVDVAARAGITEPVVYGGVDKKRYIIGTSSRPTAVASPSRITIMTGGSIS